MQQHGMVRPTLDSDLMALNCLDHGEQDLKDKIHQRLQERCEIDTGTGCWIFTGNWDRRGIAKVRVGQRTYTVSRVSAWLYFAGFELWDGRWVYHTCPNPACWYWEHLMLARNREEAQAKMRELGLFGSVAGRGRGRPGRRLNLQKARLIRCRLDQGQDAGRIAAEMQVSRQAVNMVGAYEVWPDRREERGLA